MTEDAGGFAQMTLGTRTDGSGNHNTERGILANLPYQAPKGASCLAAHIVPEDKKDKK